MKKVYYYQVSFSYNVCESFVNFFNCYSEAKANFDRAVDADYYLDGFLVEGYYTVDFFGKRHYNVMDEKVLESYSQER